MPFKIKIDMNLCTGCMRCADACFYEVFTDNPNNEEEVFFLKRKNAQDVVLEVSFPYQNLVQVSMFVKKYVQNGVLKYIM